MYFSKISALATRFTKIKIPINYQLNVAIRHQTFTTNVTPKQLNHPKPTIYSLLDKNVDGQSRIKLISVLNGLQKLENLDSVSENQATLLLECCGKISPGYSNTKRHNILETVWLLLEKNNFKFSVDHYNAYIKMCTENGVVLHHSVFLPKMKCEPNLETFKLLLENASEKGDTTQGLSLLNLMKEKGFSVDEAVFNCFVLAHTIKDGKKGGENVFKMMKTADITQSYNSKLALLRGLVLRSDKNDFDEILNTVDINLNGSQFLKLLQDLGNSGNYLWLEKLKNKINLEEFLRKYLSDLENVCIHLIHAGKPEAAFYVYKMLVPPLPDEHFGKLLIFESIRAETDPKLLLEIITALKDLNPFALEDATEAALKLQKTNLAMIYLRHMDYLRPHFFWPILRQEGKSNGEEGVLRVLEEMTNLKVKADFETLQYYCLPYLDVSYPKLLLEKLQKLNYVVRDVFTPLLAFLLQRCLLNEALNLCKSIEGKLDTKRIIKPLSVTWTQTTQIQDVITLLKKLCESSNESEDWTGIFLQNILKKSKTPVDLQKFLATAKEISKAKLRITSANLEALEYILKKHQIDETNRREILDALESLLDISIIQQQTLIPHPKEMSLDQLECHLIELESKRMETRGVLRRLIQLHSSAGNHQRVQELREKLQKMGYTESPGMKASIMHSYVTSGLLEPALEVYHELKALHKNFEIDNFKILDLVALMVREDKFTEGVKLLKDESENKKIYGGSSIERNCWCLLEAAKEPEQSEELFELLSSYGYCKPSNVILGPRVKIHLKSGDLQSAVNAYVQYANEYDVTPLQLELLKRLLESGEEELFHRALVATEKVHGKAATVSSLICAFAEQEMEKALRAFLMREKHLPSKSEFRKRYERWVSEGKIVAMETLYRASGNLRIENIDEKYLQMCILKCYCLKNDCDGALSFHQELLDKEIYISSEMQEMLYKLLKRCKFKIPANLSNGKSVNF